MENQNNVKKLASKLSTPLAVVGVVSLIIGGAWITREAIRSAPSVSEYVRASVLPRINAALVSITSVFVSAEKLTLTITPENIFAENPTTLIWQHDTNKEGTYLFHYPCIDSVALTTYENALVPCDTSLDIRAQKSVILIPTNVHTEVEIPITITFKGKQEGDVTSSVAKLFVRPSVTKKQEVTAPTTGTKQNQKVTAGQVPLNKESFAQPPTSQPVIVPTPTPVPASPTPGETTQKTYASTALLPSSTNLQADLAVRIISTGIIDGTNVYVPKEKIANTERAAIRFEIMNIGTKKAEGWYFNAVLPTFPTHIFSSESQQALGPGDKIEYTLGFDRFDITKPEGIVIINADPTGSINEKNKENNLARVTITMTQ